MSFSSSELAVSKRLSICACTICLCFSFLAFMSATDGVFDLNNSCAFFLGSWSMVRFSSAVVACAEVTQIRSEYLKFLSKSSKATYKIKFVLDLTLASPSFEQDEIGEGRRIRFGAALLVKGALKRDSSAHSRF